MKRGRLIVYTGPMGSGKTMSIIRTASLHQNKGRHVLAFKSAIDTRNVKIESRNGETLECTPIPTDDATLFQQMCKEGLKSQLDTVIIDEFQFLADGGYLTIINKLLRNGVDVYLSGLELTSELIPFGMMPAVLAYADDVFKCKSFCHDCGEYTATLTYADFEKSDDVVIEGEHTNYLSLCRDCYYKRNERRVL